MAYLTKINAIGFLAYPYTVTIVGAGLTSVSVVSHGLEESINGAGEIWEEGQV